MNLKNLSHAQQVAGLTTTVEPSLRMRAWLGLLNVPVVGVATSRLSLVQLHNVVRNHLFQIVALLAIDLCVAHMFYPGSGRTSGNRFQLPAGLAVCH